MKTDTAKHDKYMDAKKWFRVVDWKCGCTAEDMEGESKWTVTSFCIEHNPKETSEVFNS